jgi:hypothetical protein
MHPVHQPGLQTGCQQFGSIFLAQTQFIRDGRRNVDGPNLSGRGGLENREQQCLENGYGHIIPASSSAPVRAWWLFRCS